MHVHTNTHTQTHTHYLDMTQVKKRALLPPKDPQCTPTQLQHYFYLLELELKLS